MQQGAPTILVTYSVYGNKILKDFPYLNPIIKLLNLPSPITTMDTWTFSDASFNVISGRDYGQTVIVLVVKVTYEHGDHYFHLIDWKSTKLRRITH